MLQGTFHKELTTRNLAAHSHHNSSVCDALSSAAMGHLGSAQGWLGSLTLRLHLGQQESGAWGGRGVPSISSPILVDNDPGLVTWWQGSMIQDARPPEAQAWNSPPTSRGHQGASSWQNRLYLLLKGVLFVISSLYITRKPKTAGPRESG